VANILVTGANRGIGLELCRQFSLRGDKVIAACRSSSKELENLDVKLEQDIEMLNIKSFDRLATSLKGLKIDILVNNAGMLASDNIHSLDIEQLKMQFEVNALGPLVFTTRFLQNLQKGSKIILITSRMGSIEDNSSGSYYGYRMSKAGLCMVGKSLSIDLKPAGISVALVHPGLVSTRMTNFSKNGITPEESVKGIIQRIDSLTIANTGKFWHADGSELPW
tara:strand:+ start:1014 stop:1679 length:666 start_codon:yes stop_codon:yes gene_type:complete